MIVLKKQRSDNDDFFTTTENTRDVLLRLTLLQLHVQPIAVLIVPAMSQQAHCGQNDSAKLCH